MLAPRVHYSSIYNNQEAETTEMSMDRWIDFFLNVIYAQSEILFNFKKEILHYAMTWINFEDIMLTEISHSQKNK